MDIKYIAELNKSLSSNLDSVVYKKNLKDKKVSSIITIDWEGVLPEPPKNTSEETKKESSLPPLCVTISPFFSTTL
mgnify:CR=1 FL=1